MEHMIDDGTGAGLIVMVTSNVSEPPALVAVSVTGNEPLAVGVPVIAPVDPSSTSPPGRHSRYCGVG